MIVIMYTYALRDAHAIGWETGGAVIFFFLCFIIFWHYREKDSVAVGIVFPYVPVSLLVVYFPLFADIVSIKYDSGSVYIRLHWLFVMIPVTATTLAVFIVNSKKKKRIIPLLLLVFLIHPYYVGYYTPAENVYKIPDAAVSVSDIIISDCGETPVHVMVQWHEDVNSWFNDDTSESSEFHYGIRMYASNLILSYCIVTEDMWNAEDFNLGVYINAPYDYIVVRDEAPLKTGCTSLDYELMDTVDGYAVFRRGME